MSDQGAVGEEFKRKVDKIRTFLQRPTHQGGVFLVIGQRGTGKTRLVDEALNETVDPLPISLSMGNLSKRRRHQLVREPKGLNRHLLKVDVDPVFPHTGEESEQTINRVTWDLLRNIIFALTNVVDSRYSILKHGRVLRERLGFRGYWFGNALLWPSMVPRVSTWPLVLVFMFALQLLQLFVEGLVDPFGWQMPGPADVLLLIVIDILGLLPAWMLLRWRDWRALARMSQRLYDLVHAQASWQENNRTRESMREGRLNLTLVLSLLALSFLVCFVNTDSWHHAFSHWFESSTLPKAVEPRTLKAPQTPTSVALPNQQGSQNGLSQPSAPSSQNPTLIQALQTILPLLTLLSVIFVWTYKSSDGYHAHFDQSNTAWLVNLLRRYLFLCHRCGLEPVLVLDELDKLEELDEFGSKNPSKEPVNWMRGVAAKPEPKDQLILLLKALARLKASLGAEFLWILIGGQRIYGYLQEHRHERTDGNLGLLATVIHQETVLGPIALEDAREYLLQHHRPFTPQTQVDSQSRPERIDQEWEDFVRYLWLRSHGNFSALVRVSESLGIDTMQSMSPVDTLAVLLADSVQALWNAEAMQDLIDFKFSFDCFDKLEVEWACIWIRSGMIDLANHFLKPSPSKPEPTPEYFESALPDALDKHFKRLDKTYDHQQAWAISAIQTGDPQLLRLVGEQILYHQLKVEKHVFGGSPYKSVKFSVQA